MKRYFEVNPTTIANLRDELTHLFWNIKKLCLADENNSPERAQAFMDLCQQNPPLSMILCGLIPRNKQEAAVAMKAARRFFKVSNGENGLRNLEKLLRNRTSAFHLNQPNEILESLTSKWKAHRRYLKIREVSSETVTNFFDDLDTLVKFNVPVNSIYRLLFNLYGICRADIYARLKEVKSNLKHNRVKQDSEERECKKFLQLRKSCNFAMLVSALKAFQKEDWNPEEIAIACLISAVVSFQLELWKFDRKIGWWIANFEKLVAGMIGLTRRETPCSPNK